jgi:hypothetical protein
MKLLLILSFLFLMSCASSDPMSSVNVEDLQQAPQEETTQN